MRFRFDNLLLMGCFFICVSASAQREDNEFKPKLRGAVMMANSHIPSATEGGNAVSIIPTWGMDVDYYLKQLILIGNAQNTLIPKQI